jgi:predicted NBD/HSP70 family sugar kinase
MTGMATSDLGLTSDGARLLAHLRHGGPLTRGQLAELTGLARSTVATRLDVLLASGLVVQKQGASSGGRPAGVVEFQPTARTLLAVDLGATHGVVALTDLAGSVVARESADLDIADGPDPVLDWVVGAARRLLTQTGHPASHLAGVGIGLPGPVEHSTGLPTNPPIMPGWDGFDVPGYVRRRFDVPVLVDNDVNLLALGEHATIWRHADDLLFVKVATGIGAGIISGGTLQRGAQGSAGDLGHVRVPFSSRTPQHGAADADLEALASGPGIARTLTAAGITMKTGRDVFEASRAGDARVADAIRQAGRDLGEVLATCVNVLNPSVIVIGGSISRAGEHLVAGVREVVYAQSTPLATRHLTITESRAGESGGVIGAATMLIQYLLDPMD